MTARAATVTSRPSIGIEARSTTWMVGAILPRALCEGDR
jgi:hypothetical protein